MEPRNWFQGMNSASLCSLAGRYDNPIPTRCPAPIDRLKIPILLTQGQRVLNDLKRNWLAFSPSYSLASPPPPPPQPAVSLSHSSCVSPVDLTDGGEGDGRVRIQLIRRRESLVLYNSFNTLCPEAFDKKNTEEKPLKKQLAKLYQISDNISP